MAINLLDYIPEGKENAVTKEYLMRMTGWDDRTVRREIKRLVKEGVPILSSSHHKGYWISNNLDELGKFIKETDNRRHSLYNTTLKLRKYYYDKKDIKVVIVQEHMRKVGERTAKRTKNEQKAMPKM